MYAPMLTGKSRRSKHWAVRSCVAPLCMASALHTREMAGCVSRANGQTSSLLSGQVGVARPPVGRRCGGECPGELRARRIGLGENRTWREVSATR